MAVVYPEDPTPAPGGSTGQRLADFAQRHLVLTVAILLGLALSIGLLITRLRGGASASSAGTVSAPVGSTTPAGPGQSKPTGTVRAKGVFAVWDAAHSGVPIRSAPGGDQPVLDYASFGSSISLGQMLSGPVNQSDPSAGPVSSDWWAVTTSNGATGYISAADLASVSFDGAQGIGSGGDPFLEGHSLLHFPSLFQQNHKTQELHGA